jgi:HEAT repeat protein
LNLPAATIAERVEALTLLGRLGSPEYVPFLVNVLGRESNSLIKTAAVRAIGAIGIDRDGRAMSAFIREALPVFPTSDTLVLNAILEAAGKLSIINGPPIYDRGVAILGTLSVQRTFPDIQKQAAAWLKRMLAPPTENIE